MAQLKTTYAARAALTLTLASLATSATLVAGRASTAVDNTTNRYLDALLSGKITVGTTPTVDTLIEVWCYAAIQDTPSYPDGITGSDANKTITSVAIKQAALQLAAVIGVDATTSDRAYYFGPVSVASLYGGVLPDKWGAFVVHNTGVNLNSTGSNHFLEYLGIHSDSV